MLYIETGRQEAVLSRATVEGVVVVDELGGEACCVASRTLTCTAVEVAQLCTVDSPPLLPQVDDHQLAQPVHVLLKACPGDTLKTLRDPELVGTSSGTGMSVVCTFDLFVCKVLCFQ